MKKKEMVKALMEKFNHVFIGVHAEPIIDFLESQGMLPPPYTRIEKWFGDIPENIVPKQTYYREVTSNEWEPEDDQH